MLSNDASSLDQTNDLPERPDLSHAWFEAWVDRFPEAVAVTGEQGALSYTELESRSNQIAHALCSAGVQKGSFVGTFLERGPDLACALLGVLKAGAAFTALDPRSPKNVLARIFAVVDVPFVITSSALASSLPPNSAQHLLFDDPVWAGRQPRSRPMPRAGLDDPACVLFTSGSTGHLKAVLYMHRNLTSRFSNTIQVSGITPSCVFAQTSPITSIDAIDEIFLPLISGGSTVILPYETVTNPHQLVDSLSLYGVTHMLLVPSLLRVILAMEENLYQKLGALKTWIIGGEPLTAALTERFYQMLRGAVLINFYGLTEGDVSFHITSPALKYDRSVPIGHPVRGTQLHLLDKNLRPVADGEAGEICVAGEALSHQYLNCPELNAERWVINPFAAQDSQARLFRTGDLGRLRPDGELEYLGRADRMVKVHGFRVELGEVEAMLSQHPLIDQCVVLARQPAGSDGVDLRHQPYLVAYAVLKGGEMATPQELRNFLKDRLPEPAIPALVSLLDCFPLSPNGKIDVHALSKYETLDRSFCPHYVPPRTQVESKLTDIWEGLLNYHPIGVGDSFFEIGGDSLTAIDLMLTIEREFQCRLPITVLFQSPTIAALAQVIQNQGKTASLACLVPIRTHGSRPPLFCVHADGSVFIYRRFAAYLDREVPIYGLQAFGLASPKDEPYQHVDEMAAHYIREIRTVQPHGPYHMCAFSAGGLIIFEMARQLQKAGEQVAFLGLLDAYGPDYPEYLPNKNRVDYKLSVHLNTLRLHGLKGQAGYLWGRIRHRADLIVSRLVAELLLKLHLRMPSKIRYEYVARLIDHAEQTYPPGRNYPGKATLFHALTQPQGIKPDPTLGWASLVTGDLQIVDVIGTHNSIMMHEPHVAALVRKLDEHLCELHNPKSPLHASIEDLSNAIPV